MSFCVPLTQGHFASFQTDFSQLSQSLQELFSLKSAPAMPGGVLSTDLSLLFLLLDSPGPQGVAPASFCPVINGSNSFSQSKQCFYTVLCTENSTKSKLYIKIHPFPPLFSLRIQLFFILIPDDLGFFFLYPKIPNHFCHQCHVVFLPVI